jgi:serine/threonine-protein kinase HipA
MAEAVREFEQGTEDQRQLLLLTYAATALPGERPKCTWVDGEGRLAVATFGSASDNWAGNRSEVLAMRLASKAGIDVVDVKLLHPVGDPILLAMRLDRSANGQRKHVLSAHSLMRATMPHVVDHLDLLQVMRRYCLDFGVDGPKLWKRLVFRCLIHDTSDDLRKIGFVHVYGDRWSLAPAVGMRPRLPVVSGPSGYPPHGIGRRVSLQTLVEKADAFGVDPAHVRLYLRNQLNILSCWKQWASEFFVNMRAHDIQRIEPAMNNPQAQWARQFLTA